MRLVGVNFRYKLDQMIELHVQVVINADEPVVLVHDAGEIGQELEIGGKFGIKGLTYPKCALKSMPF